MREIKFRVWSSESKKMYLPKKGCDFLVRIDGGYFVDEDIVENVGLIPVEKDNYILMQYTGLKDSTGKEIYGGDYIQNEWFAEEVREVFWNSDRAVYCWGSKDMTLYKCLFDINRMNAGLSRKDKVMGNIYENPDLLKEEK